MKQVPKAINIKLRPEQVGFVEKALARWSVKCPLRFSEPEIKAGVLWIDPHDFMELGHYIERNFENELEVARLKRTANDALAKISAILNEKFEKAILTPDNFSD